MYDVLQGIRFVQVHTTEDVLYAFAVREWNRLWSFADRQPSIEEVCRLLGLPRPMRVVELTYPGDL